MEIVVQLAVGCVCVESLVSCASVMLTKLEVGGFVKFLKIADIELYCPALNAIGELEYFSDKLDPQCFVASHPPGPVNISS